MNQRANSYRIMEQMARLSRRYWPVWVALALTVALGSFVIQRARQPEFSFLAGRKPKWPDWTKKNPFSSDPPKTCTGYAFRDDAKMVIAKADKLLISAGWSKRHDSWGPDWDSRITWYAYDEPSGAQRSVFIEVNRQEPDRSRFADLVELPPYEKGMISVTISRPGKNLKWLDRARLWLEKVFLGRP